MKEKKDCKIVQDLLPNYIEKLTNEETNQYVEEHIKECEECRKTLENMQKELKMNQPKIENREVQYIKKYSNKMKMLKAIILVILIIYLLIVGRRTIILFSLSKKAENNQQNNNYYARLYSYQGDSLNIIESYNRGENYLATMTRFSNGNQIMKITFYQKDGEKIFLSEVDGKKYLGNGDNNIGLNISPVTYVSDGFMANLQYALLVGINSTYCNGKKCYVIKQDSYERYIDKDTGLAVRNIDKSTKDNLRENDMVVDYEYQYNVVKESDIVKPDITGYTLVQ